MCASHSLSSPLFGISLVLIVLGASYLFGFKKEPAVQVCVRAWIPSRFGIG
jgi:hypothetical protein